MADNGDFHEPRGPERPLFTPRRRRARRGTRGFPVLGYVGLLALAVVAGWFWQRSRGSGPAMTSTTEATAATPSPEATTPADAEGMPPLGASDEFVRRIVAGVSKHPQYASWLVTDDLARRFVITVVEIAHGRSPESHLRFMAPANGFTPAREGGRTVMDPRAYGRYNTLSETFASLDPQGAAQAYDALHPLFVKAYRELGLRDASWDETLQLAFDRLLSVDVPDERIEVEPKGAVYGFSAEALEELSPAEKHLIRMGPQNARRVQAQLRALAEAMGVRTAADAEPSPERGGAA